MSLSELKRPKKIEVNTLDGTKLNVIISIFPAVEGREILAKYPLSSIPKIGDYKVNHDTMLKLMSFVEVEKADGSYIRLNNHHLVNSWIPDADTLFRIELAALQYNCSLLNIDKKSINSKLDQFKGKVQKGIKYFKFSLFESLEKMKKNAK